MFLYKNWIVLIFNLFVFQKYVFLTNVFIITFGEISEYINCVTTNI